MYCYPSMPTVVSEKTSVIKFPLLVLVLLLLLVYSDDGGELQLCVGRSWNLALPQLIAARSTLLLLLLHNSPHPHNTAPHL